MVIMLWLELILILLEVALIKDLLMSSFEMEQIGVNKQN